MSDSTDQKGGDDLPKILFVATVPEHFRYFHLPCFQMLEQMGYTVDTACAQAEDFPHTSRRFAVPMGRNPLDPRNIKAYFVLRRILREGGYDVVHCHTPVGGVLARLAARGLRKRGLRVLYTAHGFHFYHGASLSGWLLFYPVEWFLSFCTDTLITINREDYDRASRRLHARRTAYVHGVGCDTSRFGRLCGCARNERRAQFGAAPEDRILVYVAEQNENKNQGMLLQAAELLYDRVPHLQLWIVGPDHIAGVYARQAQSLRVPVRFFGERHDIPEILSVCDVYTASSLREGLPVNVMEAMASGLPVVAMNNRGHRALVRQGETGFLVEDAADMAQRVEWLLTDPALEARMRENALQRVQKYDLQNVLEELRDIYARPESR